MAVTTRAVCITGAGGGIGRAGAMALARRGYRLGLFDRDAEMLEQTRGLCERLTEVATVQGDVSIRSDVVEGIGALAMAIGPFTDLVASAGIARYGPFETLDAADWSAPFVVNVVGVVNAISAVLPSMLATDAGLIVAVGSRRGLEPKATTSAYSASKAGVHALIRSLQLEHASSRVSFSYLAPGGTQTGLGSPKDPRFMNPETVGDAIAFMCDAYPAGWVRQLEILPVGL